MMLKMVETAVPINLNLHLRPSIPATNSKKKPGLGRAPLKKISYAVFASSSPAPGSFTSRTFDGKLLPKSELCGSNRGRWANRKRVFFLDVNPLCYDGSKPSLQSFGYWVSLFFSQVSLNDPVFGIHQMELATGLSSSTGPENLKRLIVWASALSFGQISWLLSVQVAYAAESIKTDAMYEIGELFELGIQLSYLLLLLALLGVGSFFVIRQVLVRRELDLSAKELQEQVRSGDASATELFELGAVMLRRKFYPAATKYLLEAIDKWDGDDQDLAQVHNALGVTYVRDGKLDKGIAQFKTAVKLQPGYVTAWNNLGDAHEKNKDLQAALNAFEEALLFDPTNKVARPRRDALKDRVSVYKGVPVKSKDR